MPTATASPTPLPLAEWLAEGDAALLRSDFAAAEKAYQRAIEADPQYAPAHVSLAWLYGWLIGRDQDALAEAQRATELDPGSAAAWTALSAASIWRADTPGGLKAAEKALELDPKRAQTQAVLARAYLADRQYDAAVKAAEEAVKLDPKSAFAYHVLSRVHEGISDYGRARAAREQTIALEPQFAPWRYNLGELLALLQRYDEADEQYAEALKLAPDHPQAWLGQARIHSYQQEYDQIVITAGAVSVLSTERQSDVLPP
jgi:tetratricopeptide (TPR) repeat protein